jgi:hypothetical protein
MTESALNEMESVLSEDKKSLQENEEDISDKDDLFAKDLNNSQQAEQIRLKILKQYIKQEIMRDQPPKKGKKVRIEDGLEHKPSPRSKVELDELEEGEEEDEEEVEEIVEPEESEEEEEIKTPPPRKKQKPMEPPKRVVEKRSVSSNPSQGRGIAKKLVFV